MNEPKLQDANYSLVFAVPKPQFFIWLERTLQKSGRRVQGFYFEQEDLACLIPSVHTFDSQEALTAFLDPLKVIMLKRTLGEIGTGQVDCPEISCNTFDEFFDLKI